MLGASLIQAVYHPNKALQLPWNLTQVGLVLFPLSPFLGAVLIVLASLITLARQWGKIIRRPINWGFALLTVLLIITAGFADDKTLAYVGLFNFVPYFIVFAGLSALFQKIAQLRQMAWILVIASVPITILGLGQFFLGWSLNLTFLWVVLEWTIAPGGEPPGRMSSILMHANTLGTYLVILFTLCLGLGLEQWQLITKQIQTSKTPLIFLTITGIINFIALIFTNSRNAWAIAIFVCLAYAVYQGWRILVGGVSAIATCILLAAFAPSPFAQFFRRFVPAFFWARLNDDMYPDRPVGLMRKTQWEFAWSLTQQHPWTGWGLRNFTGLYQAKTQISLGHPHNLFLMLTAETGIPSTLLFCGLIGWILYASVKLLREAKFPIYEDKLLFFTYIIALFGWLLSNTVDVTLYDFRLNTLSWLMLSAVCGLVYRYNQDNKLKSQEN
ncbi:O-antigen ligase family protein [Tolypothrix sp. FACHB-123]|uniref:O-antigen ligase family protein n=1 Tax=Tolypothrix sp. FACHB-123 TaxID=2692868 RepID=UPI001688D36B|nr:O-antigen ligase [Tolypothrix sp. FACHB-123]MBD2354515.1 O-antigen ligase family protein [Tolypothrix sp. FACHB-123]